MQSDTNKRNLYLVLPFVVAIITDDKGNILIGRHPKLDRKPYPGFWDLPGGKMEVGETPEEAIRREVKEELQLDVEEARLFEVFHHSGSEILPSCTSNIPGLAVCYVLRTIGEISSTEQDEVHFADKKELITLKGEMTPWALAFLERYFEDY